ncbi:MAG TPA: hypothetical protein VF665_07365 [Longimicrobium sp.]|jgi:hypothetical protein|uniref:hypothetical protein n=1 Tax=Longimicrobium sp. TaxID=2029185 RepID=UPI002EDB7CAE
MYVDLGLRRCGQRWDEMKPVEGGRLCGACDRRIVDFRQWTDVEIALAHVRSEQPVCGVYSDPQLARMGMMDAAPPQPGRRLPVLALGASLLGTAAHAQTPGTPPVTAAPRPSAEPAPARRNEVPGAAPQRVSRVIRGTVRDTAGHPLRDVIVWIGGSSSRVTRTDSAGAYRLYTGEEPVEEVVISRLGFRRQVIRPRWAGDESVIDAVLAPEVLELTAFVVSARPASRWRRFRAAVGRIF